METLNFSQIRELYKAMPPKKMLWSGVKEKSFGLVFGPSKSGKTIFCENLAIAIAVGKDSYFDYPLDGIPKKVLFIGLEECWDNRAERNISQFETLNEEEQLLMNENYCFQPIHYAKFITTEENWETLNETIAKSGAEVVFIDSITRLTLDKLEEGKVAGKIMSSLRTISQDLNITLFAIHHTPKLHGSPIVMDSIKGSGVFAQESDFAIGINRTDKKHRYMKNVFFRYASDDDEFVKEFKITDDAWLDLLAEVDEDEILLRTDRRRAEDKRDLVRGFFDSNPSVSYSYIEAIENLKPLIGLQDRQLKTYLSELSKANKIDGSEKGYYRSVNYQLISEGGNVE
jgi:adenosyl cobinamide kinase/adenosyl cobinamide phosphate guanylyltransferase